MINFTRDEVFYVGINLRRTIPSSLEREKIDIKTISQVKEEFNETFLDTDSFLDLRTFCEDLKRINLMEGDEEDYLSVRITHTIINDTIIGEYVELKRDWIIFKNPQKACDRMSESLVRDIIENY